MELNKPAVLLSLSQVIQAGVKRHFRAARFERHATAGSGNYLGFQIIVLGLRFDVRIKCMGEE